MNGHSSDSDTTATVGTYPGASEEHQGQTQPDNPCVGYVVDQDVVLPQAPLPRRKSPRAEFHDYSGGVYFVTICTANKEHYFGEILNEEMRFTQIGRYCQESLSTLYTHYSYVEVPLFVVMPNHIHLIISINERPYKPDVPGYVPTSAKNVLPKDIPSKRTALSVVIGQFKQAVTMFARSNSIEFAWQSRYHDHIIRGAQDGNNITDYIKNNVARWSQDCFYKQ